MLFHHETKQIKGFAIDLDGMLLDTESMYKKAWLAAASQLGFKLDAEVVDKAHGLSGQAWEMLLKGHIVPLALWKQFTDIATDHWEKQRLEGVPTLPGAREMLDFMSSEGIPHMIATNSPRIYANKNLEASTLNIGKTGMICRDDVNNAKPDPEMIKAVAQSLNTGIKQLAVLEDSESGILAAVNSGAYAVYVQRKQQMKVKSIAHQAYQDLHQCLNAMRIMQDEE